MSVTNAFNDSAVMLRKNMTRLFGEIEGNAPGKWFKDRAALSKARVHGPTIAGISGGSKEGADSIVLSDGYEDDEDYGDVIIYTGAGGRDENTGRQIADQTLTRVNLAMAKSKLDGLPVRVSRGYKHDSEYSPKTGCVYVGLYSVDDYWIEKGLEGFDVCRFRLIALPSIVIPDPVVPNEKDEAKPTQRKVITSSRVVRDASKALKVKNWHKYECQVCGLAIKTRAGLYAEAAHIVPLGAPHDGPDTVHNMLCLCPNHHKMFDNGGFSVDENLNLIGIEGVLRLHKKHDVDMEALSIHSDGYLGLLGANI
jgi:putative restriction endonuclease